VEKQGLENKNSTTEKKVKFFCVCGSTEYKKHRKNSGIMGPGAFSITTHYECAGCSVLFADPQKYTEAAKRIIAEKFINFLLGKSSSN